MTKQRNISSSFKRSLFQIRRFFTKAGIHPFDEIKWVKRNVEIGNFKQENVEFPDFWSENAVNITASKYFRGKIDSPSREKSLKQVIERVVKTIRKWGEDFGYFKNKKQAQIFEDELIHLLVYQKASFNSPVWFNVGIKDKPQCSACFILSVEDDMVSILDWIRTEGLIFKGGSGAGVNLSKLRAKNEPLSGGGYSSGPVSFMRGADAVAGMIKSGGTTRRAAKMVILDIDHPDILEFIRCKAEEEKKIRALMAAGYDMTDLNNEAWSSIQFQNANNSVRIPDEFMHAVLEDKEWSTFYRTSGKVAKVYKARELLGEIAQAAWECGDPGVQFDTIINSWHTCPNSGRINASNPCSEYMHLDNSACNLASLNLLKFLKEDKTFDVKAFKQAVDIMILAQEIIVDGSSYPTPQITENAHNFRELGLGFSNLGAFLMEIGLAYDSDKARALAASIASLMSGEAYRFSAAIASLKGPFNGFEINKDPMLKVINRHLEAALNINHSLIDQKDLSEESIRVWQEALRFGQIYGFRNSQVTVIAPTGTISLMMDCDTTGIEPDFSLVKVKKLVGGGWLKIVNQTVPKALAHLGYLKEEIEEIVNYILEEGTVEGAPYIREEHLPIFDTAVKPLKSKRVISWQGHVRMVAAVQPFISGAISKTFNIPHETTREEIEEAYIMAWKLGIKAFAVYRDGSKASQPLQVAETEKEKSSQTETQNLLSTSLNLKGVERRRLPITRPSETHKFVVGGHEGYLTYSFFEDGSLAEIFIRIAKQGSTLAGLLDVFSIAVSLALQYGVPFKVLAEKFIHSRFEPAGYTENPQVLVATSIVDYIFRYLALKFLPKEDLFDLGISSSHFNQNFGEGETKVLETIKINYLNEDLVKEEVKKSEIQVDNDFSEKSNKRTSKNGNGYVYAGTVCKKCGGMMIQSGSCYTCLECGESSGGCS